MKVRIPKVVILAAALISVIGWTVSPAIGADKPNIVIVFMDNFGWGSPASTVAGSFEAP